MWGGTSTTEENNLKPLSRNPVDLVDSARGLSAEDLALVSKNHTMYERTVRFKDTLEFCTLGWSQARCLLFPVPSLIPCSDMRVVPPFFFISSNFPHKVNKIFI